MNGLSIIIPSRTASNLIPCTQAIRECGETGRIIIVDDGIDWSASGAAPINPFVVIKGEKPFVFARNVNIGIEAAGKDDVIILNDDAILKSPLGFTAMQNVSQSFLDHGLIASTCNNVGNMNQLPTKRANKFETRAEPRTLCFVCVLIPRRTIDAVGLLDERFVDYGLDDDDYCLRVRNAFLKLGIFDGCFVDHGSLNSSYRGAGGAGGDFKPNLRRFIEKWGHDNWGQPRETSQWPELFR